MASCCFLHVGQCGVQLGRTFWDTLLEWDEKKAAPVHELKGSSVSPFSLHSGILPCVVADSEPKPANSCFGHGNSPHNLMSDAILTDRTGRGNNWASGYSEGQKQPKKSGDGMVERVRDAVRRVAEQCDCFMGVVIFHSIAGGTGSGLTSRVVEQLREDYPNQYILCVSVAPFQSGETPMQHYNSLLCLHWLQSYCDCIMLVQNDAILHQITAQHTAAAAVSRKINDVSFTDMNHLISHCVCNGLMPIKGHTKKRFSHPVVMEPWELTRSLCPDPLFKFVSPSHFTTKPSTTWDTTLSHLLQDVKLQRKDIKTQSIVLVGRGNPSAIDGLIGNLKTVEKRIKNAYNTVDWNPFPVDSWLSSESHSSTKYLSILANSSRVNSFLDMVCNKSQLMYSHMAYWHWYEQYGLERETFEQAYHGVRTVIDNYKQLNEQ